MEEGKEVAATKPTPKDFPALLSAWLPEIKRALPQHLNADRMARIALTAFRRTPKLGECDPRSVFAAVIQASQLGLEPDTLGRSYLIPYKVSKKTDKGWESHYECQFVPGWKGLVDLLNRSKDGTAWTGAVFQGDEFAYQLGDQPFVRHAPKDDDDADRLTHVYAVGRTKGSDWPIIEVWTAARVRKHRDRYNKVGDKHYSYQNWEMYARKVVLLQVLKYMPCSAELTNALTLNDAAETGRQNLGIQDAIEGTWSPAPEDHDQSEPIHQTTHTVSGRKKPQAKKDEKPAETPAATNAAPQGQPEASAPGPKGNDVNPAAAAPDLKLDGGANPNATVSDEQIASLKTKMAAFAINEADLLRAFKIPALPHLKAILYAAALKWCGDPTQAPQS